MNAREAVEYLRGGVQAIRNAPTTPTPLAQDCDDALAKTAEIDPAPPCTAPVWKAILDICQTRGVTPSDDFSEESVIGMVQRLGQVVPGFPPNAPLAYGERLFERLMQFCLRVKGLPPPFSPAAGWHGKSIDLICALENHVLAQQARTVEFQRAQLEINSLQDQLNEAAAALVRATEQRDEAWRVISKLVQK